MHIQLVNTRPPLSRGVAPAGRRTGGRAARGGACRGGGCGRRAPAISRIQLWSIIITTARNYINVYMYTHIYINTSIYLSIYLSISLSLYIYIYRCICMYVCMYVYIYIYIYIYVYTARLGWLRALCACNGRLTAVIRRDDWWQLFNQVIVLWYVFIQTQTQSPDDTNDWQQSHHMIVSIFRCNQRLVAVAPRTRNLQTESLRVWTSVNLSSWS